MGAITFVGTYAIPEGSYDEWSAAMTDMIDFVKANSPRLISFDSYLDDDRGEATTIYVHPDSASLADHLQLAAWRINRGVQLVRTIRVDLYGDPSDEIVSRLRAISEKSNGFPVTVKRHFYG